MPLEIVLSIVGGFMVVGLGINGFFLRGIFRDLNEVKIQFAVSIENSRHKEQRITNLENDVKELKLKLDSLS